MVLFAKFGVADVAVEEVYLKMHSAFAVADSHFVFDAVVEKYSGTKVTVKKVSNYFPR